MDQRIALTALACALLGGACTVVGVPPADPPPPVRTGPIGRPVEKPSPASVPPAAAPGGTARAAGLRSFDEVRGLWVVRYSLTSPQSVRDAVERAAAAGFNTLLVQVRGRGDAVHPSALEPRLESIERSSDFDPLALVVAVAHARGLAVHAWLNVNVVTELSDVPDDPRHLARAHPEALMVPRELARELVRSSPYDPRYLERLMAWSRAHDDRVEGLYVGPWHARVRERFEAVAVDLVERYDLDGIHLDYIRYPGPDFDYSAGAITAFRDWAAPRLTSSERRTLDRAAGGDPLSWPDGQPELWAEFRRAQVTRLVERVNFAVKTRRPWVTISAAVYPDTLVARRDRLQDWPAWARGGLLDAVAPMAYESDDALFRGQVEQAVAAAPAVAVWAGIGSYLTGLQGTLRKILIARDVGTDGLVLFSYDWAVGRSGGGGPEFLDRVGRSFEPPRGCAMCAPR
jgi:uncharacterized lipoprotein YddW (UPF0748 family)